MNVEIGTELAQFLFWEYIMGFYFQCTASATIRYGMDQREGRGAILFYLFSKKML
jgi:hypothetical protein